MGNIIKAIQIALGILPHVIEVIKAVEVQGNGQDKKGLVLAIIGASIEEFAGSEVDAGKMSGFVSRVIDLVVGFLNKVGIFKK